MNNLLASVVTVVVLVPTPAFGKTPALDDGPKEFIMSVPPRVMLASPLVVLTAREAARVAKLPQTPSSPQPLQRQSWASRHPVALGSLIGLGAGFALGTATCTYPGSEPCGASTYELSPRMTGGIFVGVIGTGIGAGIGAIVSAMQR
jgi:hypothetical protein